MTSRRVRALPGSPGLTGGEIFYADDGATPDVGVTSEQIRTFTGRVIYSATAPANPVAGQTWVNTSTGLISEATVPTYAWDRTQSGEFITLSNSNLTATNTRTVVEGFVRSGQPIPTATKFVYRVDIVGWQTDGISAFGLTDQNASTGNSQFLGGPASNGEAGIGFYIKGNTGWSVFANNATPNAGADNTPGTGTYYVAVDPVNKLLWVNVPSVGWVLGDPVAGTGGASFSFLTAPLFICAQPWYSASVVTLDTAATGLSVPSGYTTLSQIVQWVPIGYTSKSQPASWVNIKDYGTVGDGVADDAASFLAFTADYQGQEVVLYVPPGIYVSYSNEGPTGTNAQQIFVGIKKITIFAYGASFKLGAHFCGNNGFPTNSTAQSALIVAAKQGDSTLTLKDVADHTKFSTGDWIMVTALDIQSSGYPPNFHFFEFKQIAFADTTTSIVLRSALTDDYNDNHPAYTTGFGGSSGANCGGPATIFRMNPGWNQEQIWYGAHFFGGAICSPIGIRKIVHVDCVWNSDDGSNSFPTASVSQEIIYDRCDISPINTIIEVDKDCEIVTFKNCTVRNFASILIQSSSIKRLNIYDSHIEVLNGTPRNCIIKGSYIGSLNFAPRTAGAMESVTIEDTDVGSFNFWPLTFLAEGVSNYTYSNGTFTKAVAPGTGVNWAVPGVRCAFEGNLGFNLAPPTFMVTAVRGDQVGTGLASNVFIDTTLPYASLPTYNTTLNPNFNPGAIRPSHCPDIHISNCRGALANYEQNGGPFFKHDQLVQVGNQSTNVAQGFSNLIAFGYIKNFEVEVVQVYTGANVTQTFSTQTGQKIRYYDSSFVLTDANISVNAKIAGKRTWANGSWSGLQSGDSFDAIPAGAFATFFAYFKYNATMAGDALYQMPMIRVTIDCDLGVWEYPAVRTGPFFFGGNAGGIIY